MSENRGLNETARIEAFSDGVFAIAIFGIAFFDAELCLVFSVLFALYFALPPSLFKRFPQGS